MPYIDQEIRDYYDPGIEEILSKIDRLTTPGDVSYIISRILLHYISINDKNYQFLEGIIGKLDLISYELKRRMIAPYEDQKIEENGDLEGFE